MDTLKNKTTQITIREIVSVNMDNSIIELYLNIIHRNKKLSLCIYLNYDGETFSFEILDHWIISGDLKYEIYSVNSIKIGTNEDNELSKLINNEIVQLMLGINDSLDPIKREIYYFLLITNKNKFLFFNNGDEGKYSFDRIDEITTSDIYHYTWTPCPLVPTNN